MNRHILAFCLLLGFLFLIYCILSMMSKSSLYSLWNKFIEEDRDNQNTTDHAFRNIPSLQSAWVCRNDRVRALHRNIFILHQDLLDKIGTYFKAMIECADNPDSSFDDIFDSKTGNPQYFPFIINGKSTSLVEAFNLELLEGEITNLGLIILDPGMKTQWNSDPSHGIYRYHYGLKVPNSGDYGLLIREDKDKPVHRIRWKEKQGFIWDPSYDHYIFNSSNESCLLIVADVFRDINWKYGWINRFVHTHFPV